MSRIHAFVKDLASQLFVTARACIALLSVALCMCSLTVPQSDVARLLVAGIALFCVSFIYPRRFRYLPRVFSLVLPLTIIWCAANPVASRPEIFTVQPTGRRESFVSRLVREEDGIYPMARLLPFLGGISARESDGLMRNLQVNYAAMRDQVGGVPSPLVRTYLGLQSAEDFDVLSFKPLGTQRGTVIFLHGFGGNWSLLCWLVSQPSAEVGFRTLCPSVGPLATWGSKKGLDVVQHTMKLAAKMSSEPPVLIGLSSGAVGAGMLAPEIEEELSGVAMLFGAHPKVAQVSIPILSVYGTYDERFPVGLMDEIADHIRGREKGFSEVRLEGADHFDILKNPERVQATLRMWLQQILDSKSKSIQQAVAATRNVTVTKGEER